MDETTTAPEVLIYDARLAIVGVTEFGYPLQALTSGSSAPPAGGARFDVAFEGTIEGRLNGKVSGVDYVNVRADGRIDLDIHGRIETTDGAALSFHAAGLAIPDPGGGGFRLFETPSIQSSDPRYSWLNALPIWGRGTFELARGEIRAKAFTIPR